MATQFSKQPRTGLPFRAASAHCQLMCTFSNSSTPNPFHQGYSQLLQLPRVWYWRLPWPICRALTWLCWASWDPCGPTSQGSSLRDSSGQVLLISPVALLFFFPYAVQMDFVAAFFSGLSVLQSSYLITCISILLLSGGRSYYLVTSKIKAKGSKKTQTFHFLLLLQGRFI